MRDSCGEVRNYFVLSPNNNPCPFLNPRTRLPLQNVAHPQAFGPSLLPRLFLHVRGNGDELWDYRLHGWDAIRRRPSILGWRVKRRRKLGREALSSMQIWHMHADRGMDRGDNAM